MSEDQVTAVEQQSQPSETTASPEPVAQATWRDSLPDDLKSNNSLSKFSDVSTLAKSYINAEQMIGKDKMVVPGDNTTEDEWNDIYTKLGRPSDAGSYELNVALEEGQEIDPTLFSGFKEAAHANGLSPKQAQGILDYYGKISQQGMEQDANSSVLAQESNARELREEWGRSYDDNLAKAASIGKQYLGEDAFQLQMADGSMLGDNPTLIKGLAKLAMVMSEDTLVGDKDSVTSNAGVQQQLNDLTKQGSAYWNKQDPNHDATVQKVYALRQVVSG
tara:strand:- start:879 stop:1706 length:828 start_codon:yes stop_codon:yes gene_type:complete